MTGEQQIRDLESRLRLLEDLQEIQQLFIDYGLHLDAGDFDAYAELFTTDAVLRLGPVARADGRDEIKRVMSATLAGQAGSSYHIISSPQVTLHGDTATSQVMWTVVHRQADGQPRLTMMGRHVDELRRENGRWRIARRKGFVDIPTVYRSPD